ncbi:MAG: dehydrogenase [Cyanobacteria bacterium QH_8_48_120]|jgi:geranylgeranyl reductase family protein|nr:MAG: dehydrogenase [Cyanobacteria bacterium QS_1_48_34]PSO71375.1 MAG: dehydrogenase [Cyanobacteria bacterium QH_8_48_120]PSO77029.1 MAG: dehydrogenase [Cyanobacteria bacterium QH_3_48_40]PSO79761.1 MAG: dehydrogenase [Cyanobacteria bacterium QS_5_48_63]PSO85252.1 MAG: dehydrogenase [Cyanobacteria bacterium QS_3_48_167]PSO96946.1 MAG: dehydrogenase [Cyanobacteria bacterium QS_6_48_18]PSP20366.1 MAG: dehydrogenase [Cyanobacteria bacterium SW_5_48_44]
MFDCIIVGAGPAGATAAYHLAKRGHAVLVLEKDSLPRYKPCGGGVSPAVRDWFDFDFAPAISHKISKVRYTWKMGDPVEVKLDTTEPMWMVRRDVFDNFLMEQAQNQGAELKDNTEVTAVECGSNGASVTTAQGTFSAPYLIAADGSQGPLAKWLGFSEPEQFLGAAMEIEAPVTNGDAAHFEFGSLKNGFLWNFPKADGYSLSAGFFRGNKGKPEQLQKQLADYAKQLGFDPSQGKYYAHPMRLWSENRQLHTSQALLAGEAAGILDPLTAEGIRPSIFSGYQAAMAIDQALAKDGEALSKYTQTIREQWGDDMALAHRLAGVFYQFPKIAYKVGVKRPLAAQLMSKILCGEMRYADITERAIARLKSSFIPGRG